MKEPAVATDRWSCVRLLHVVPLGLGAVAIVLWFVFLISGHDNASIWHKDWLCFYTAGERFLVSGPVSAYTGQCIEGYFWLYPPYLLYLYAMASLLEPLQVYALAAIEIIGLTAWSLRLLRSSSRVDGLPFHTVTVFVLGSAALFTTIVTGQHSALLLFAMAGSMWSVSRDRRFLAGLFLGILGIKPNWAIFVVVWLLVTKRWRELGGMVSVGSVMILSTIPLGLETWEAYLTTGSSGLSQLLNRDAGEAYAAYKLVTFEAFTRSTVGALSSPIGKFTWLALEALAALACLIAWLRSTRFDEQLAITILVIVSANPYVEFYDVLVLAVPATVWWKGIDGYGKRTWRVIAFAVLCIWSWQWIWMLVPTVRWPSMTGGFLLVWIAAETSRHITASRGGLK